jgi:hypothetical protein
MRNLGKSMQQLGREAGGSMNGTDFSLSALKEPSEVAVLFLQFQRHDWLSEDAGQCGPVSVG